MLANASVSSSTSSKSGSWVGGSALSRSSVSPGSGGAMRTPSSMRWPRRRLSASTICVCRCRSISFCTKLLGTDSSANPSAMVSGLTRVSQARCCGVSGGVVRSSLVVDGPSGSSPLSSETTVFHTAANGASRIAVNDENPLWRRSRVHKLAMTAVHIVIHRVVDKYSVCFVVARETCRSPRIRTDQAPSFGVCALVLGPSRTETALAEATGFGMTHHRSATLSTRALSS